MKDLENMVNGIAAEIFRLYDGLDITEDEQEAMEENGEPCSLYDYFSDALDIEFCIGPDMQFRSVRIAVTLGGPNIYVDTRRGVVEGFWGTEHYERWVPSEICDEINNIFEEYFTCVK